MSEMCCTRLAKNTGRKNDAKMPSGHHHTHLSGYIFTTKVCIDNRKKNLLNSNISSRCPHNMVNFGPLAAEMLASLGHPCKFQRVSHLGRVTARYSSSGRQPNFAARRPSRWALAHILVLDCSTAMDSDAGKCPNEPQKMFFFQI